MKIWHRGKLAAEHGDFLQKSELRIKPIVRESNPDKPSLYEFIIEEDDPAWPEVKRRLGDAPTYVRTEFSQDEIARADWSIAWADHSIDNVRCGTFAWSEDNIADLCKTCGTGWRQIQPFRIKREPKLGKNVFADFGSAFELFCAPVVVNALKTHGASGFDTQPIILNAEDRPAASLMQLLITETAKPSVAEELVEHERYCHTDCPVCGRTWHGHYTRGALPLRKSALNPKVDFQLTGEWFGNGRTARHEILVSRRMVQLALDFKWRGIQFIPVRTV
jgi:hypothetical protein